MTENNGKKALEKLKKDLKGVEKDVFESGSVVDNLKEEFKQESELKKPESKPFSKKELSEEDLEDELRGKSEEDLLESETLLKSSAQIPKIAPQKQENPKIEEKIISVPAPQSQPPQSPAPSGTSQSQTPVKQPEQAPAPSEAPVQLQSIPPPMPKKKSKKLLILLILLPAIIIAGVVLFLLLNM